MCLPAAHVLPSSFICAQTVRSNLLLDIVQKRVPSNLPWLYLCLHRGEAESNSIAPLWTPRLTQLPPTLHMLTQLMPEFGLTGANETSCLWRRGLLEVC